MRTPASRRSSASRKGPSCGLRKPTTDSTRLVDFADYDIPIYGWLARGGVIILSDATHVDFTFLSLSTTSPPLKRRLLSTATTSIGDDKDQPNSRTAGSSNDTGGVQPAERGRRETRTMKTLFACGCSFQAPNGGTTSSDTKSSINLPQESSHFLGCGRRQGSGADA